ncbi:MAG TPA: RHS repeat-associated core domain-containing protein, partial [Crocinitomicaceae bacterium]|nr:RHS repeat-associated core domain-containing protein [Crocinitomicaceae bacterium]
PQLGVKIKMYYDPLGRVVKTVNPDRSEQRVIFGMPTQGLDKLNSFVPTPWENYAYDANDLAPLTNPNSNVPSSHFYTPKSSLVDALGRTVQTTEHKAHYNATAEHYEDVVMSYRYDIRGNLLAVKDPYNRTVFEHKYDLRPPQKDENGEQQPLPPLWTRHIDSGESVVLFDVTGKAIESEDAKNARSLSAYDVLQRPIYGWSKNNNTDTLRLTAYAVYGEEATTPKTTNLNGQLWKQYDESGKIESVAFDFKGNLLSKKQQVISSTVLKTALDNYETYLVDWTGLPNILDTTIFETSSEFDALNRVTKITLPENVNSERKEITPTYNRAGALEKVSYDGNEYVKNIGYNAKGQRLLIAFGNDIMTRYCYHNITFRLLRQRSEKYVKTKDGNKFIYTPQSGTNKQDDGFNFDLVGNILKILHRVNDCGINGSLLGSNALDRNFDYDPLYRVVSADGRESDTQNQNDYLYSDAPAPGTPNANNVRAYTRKYAFDKLGNIQQLKQLGTNGFTRNFTYNTGHNTLQKVETPTPTLIEDFTYDACGNQLTAGTTRNYVWNAGNQLVTYYNQAGSADPTIFAQYDYSGMNRVSKLVKTGTTYERTIYIDGIFEYHKLENGTTYEKNEIHIMDDKSRIAMVRVGTPFPDDIADAVTYNLEDQIGSSCVRLNTYGTVIDREEYYPYGDSSLRTFTKKRYRYVGKEKDLESGLYYYGARYYLAWTCRFISVDPLSAKYAQLSPYNYADNNPINDYDIDGMQNNNSEGSKGSVVTGGGGGENAQSSSNSTPINDPNGLYEKLETVKITASKKIKTSQTKESSKGSGWTRFWGGVKAVGGIVEATVGAVLIATGVGGPLGVILVAHGSDVTASGIIQASTGKRTETLTYQGIKGGSKKLGASDEMATAIAEGVDNGISLSSGLGVGTGLKNASTLSKVATTEVTAAKTGATGFEALVQQLPKAGQQNVRILQNWAKSKGYVKGPNTGGPQTWGVYDDAGNFSWRLKIKAEGSLRPGLEAGSQVPRFDARLSPGNYVNPFTGKTGGKNIGTHIPLY